MKCQCGNDTTIVCKQCKKRVCSDNNCVTYTVAGWLCGTYTVWGCARKYTTCDVCMNDEAVHEEDLEQCEDCKTLQCGTCAKKHVC